MSAPQNANDLLFAGGGAPALQWAHPETQQDFPVGTFYEGEVVKTSAVRQRDIKDKSKLAVWPDGSPKYVAIVTLKTGLRDPAVEEDDGTRSLWVSGKYLTNAVKAAVKKTGAHEIEEGGHLKVTLSGYGKAEGGYRPPRFFEVVYTRPSPERRIENAERKKAFYEAQMAGPQGDSSDPWGAPTSDRGARGGPIGDPAPQQYAQGGVLPPAPQTVTNTSGAAIPLDVSGATPEAQKLIAAMLAQQQAAQGGGS